MYIYKIKCSIGIEDEPHNPDLTNTRLEYITEDEPHNPVLTNTRLEYIIEDEPYNPDLTNTRLEYIIEDDIEAKRIHICTIKIH